jgi:hypothetical protein
MLDDALWQALRLKPATLESRGAFFLQYAESLTQALAPDLHDLIRRAEVGDARDDEPLTWLEELHEDNDEDIDAVAGELPRRKPRGFDLAIQADALREAALAMLTVDVQEGLGLLRRSGNAYAAANVPYGIFLLALADPAEGAPTEAALTLVRAWPRPPEPDLAPSVDRPGDESERERPEDRLPPVLDSVAAAARDPAQQLYLALAARQDPHLDREYRELFDRFVEQPQARSSVAVGSAGLPLGDWWSLVSELPSLAEPDDQVRADMRARLREFAIEHGRQLARAQGTALWDDGRAAVDIVDLDVAGATCLAVRRMRFAGVTPLSEDDFADVEGLGMVSLSVGLDMAREDEAPVGVARG